MLAQLFTLTLKIEGGVLNLLRVLTWTNSIKGRVVSHNSLFANKNLKIISLRALLNISLKMMEMYFIENYGKCLERGNI